MKIIYFILALVDIISGMVQVNILPKYDKNVPTIACVGDSLTYGAGVNLTRDKESYPAYLQQLVGEKYQVVNLGISGCTVQEKATRPYVKKNFYKPSLEMKADIYIIMLGSNDTKPFNWNEENVLRDYTALVESYRQANPQAEIFVMQPPKAFDKKLTGKPAYNINNSLIENELYNIVAQVGETTGAKVIDLYTLTKDHPEWFPDSVHGNAECNKAMAEHIYSKIF